MAQESILIGRGDVACELLLKRANRHGLVAGATGTGKTVTLQVLAEGFSRAGVPVFCADIKGDLSGIAAPGKPNPKLEARAKEVGEGDYAYEASPVVFWDVFGEQGHPLRATVAEMGPLLLARMLELNDTQEGVLSIAFKLADDEGLLLLDFKDLRAVLNHVGERAEELRAEYGQVSKASIGTIQRRLLMLEQAGAEHFFGEPALALSDLMLATPEGRGAVNVLAADKLVHSPRLYATFLLWLLSELFEELPEVGDPDKPKLVFFFDEAHMLFRDAPRALVDKVETVVRLIRSKGVGVYFVTQNPLDLPLPVLGQLGNRVQHALRAFTPHGPEGRPLRRRDLPPEPEAPGGRRDHPARRRRGPGLDPGRRRHAHGGGARPHRPAPRPHRPAHGGGAQGGARAQPGRRPLRHPARPRLGLRSPGRPRHGHGRGRDRRPGAHPRRQPVGQVAAPAAAAAATRGGAATAAAAFQRPPPCRGYRRPAPPRPPRRPSAAR